MKWLIASDLHGSEECCALLLEAFRQERADRLLLLGDVLYKRFGSSRQKQNIADMLKPLADRIASVRGNCDSDADLALLPFDTAPDFIRIPIGKQAMFATHGHIYNETYLPPRLEQGDVLLHGHTHVPETANRGRYLCFCPGSAAQPRWGSPRSYMTLEDGVFRWMTLEGEEYRRYEL